MGKVGRNEPCLCGSGRKYERCCLAKAGGGGFGPQDRSAALERLSYLRDGPGWGARVTRAEKEFWGDFLGGMMELGERFDHQIDMAEDALWAWFDFDVALENGQRPVDGLLAQADGLPAGEAAYLRQRRASVMRLREVVDVKPGSAVRPRAILDGRDVEVRERLGSQATRGTRGSRAFFTTSNSTGPSASRGSRTSACASSSIISTATGCATRTSTSPTCWGRPTST